MENNLSFEDIERLRAILAAHDKDAAGKVNEFDLNAPPKLPYRHQEFPRAVYHHAKHQTTAVKNQAELKRPRNSALSLSPFPPITKSRNSTKPL